MRLKTGLRGFHCANKKKQAISKSKGFLIWRPVHLHPLSIFDTVNKQINAQSTPAGCCAIMMSF